MLTRFAAIAFVAGWLPYPEGRLVISDVRLYSVWSIMLSQGLFPVGDDMWQYPPAAGVVFALPRLIGPTPVAGFFILALLADLAVMAALLLTARSRGTTLAGPWLWAVAALVVGPVLVARFDVFPTLFAVLTLLLVTRPRLSGIAAGAGALLKVWPALLLVALPRRVLLRGGTAFVATVAAGWLLLSLWASGGVSFLSEQGERGLQLESVGGLPYLIANTLGIRVAYAFRYGSQEIDMAGAREIGLLITVVGLLLMAAVLVARLLGRLEHVPPADVALAVVLVSVATSRVFSPQYAVWLLGIAAVALLDRATAMRPVVALLVPMALVAQVIYPWGYGSLMGGGVLSVTLQTVRIGLLVTATFLALRVVYRAARAGVPMADLDGADDAVDAPARESGAPAEVTPR